MKIFEERGYTYQKHLSTGGEGEVHLLKSVDKKFVAKIFPTLSKSSVNILKTIQSLNILGIPSIHDIFDYEDKTIVIRDYVEGTTLYDEITKNEYLSLKRAKTIILKICKILRQLHNAKPKPIIYRDLKPENIMITPKGDVKLIDFGIARYYNQESIRDTVLAGTKGYTAPEVMAGMQSDTRSDVYSAGLLFYEMLTGKNLLVPPFQIRPVKESNELLPEWIDSVIEKATDLNQTKRYRTIEEFIDAIENPKQLKKRRGLAGRSFKVIGIAIAVVIIIAGALLIIDNLDTFKSLFSEENTDSGSSAEVLLNMEFDDEEDLSWLMLDGEGIDYGDIEQVEIGDFMQDSIYTVSYCTDLKLTLSKGSFFHIRVKPDDMLNEGIPAFIIEFIPQLDTESNGGSYNIMFENKVMFSSVLTNDYGYYYKSAGGSPILVESKWIDLIVYLDENGESFKYFVSETESDKFISYGGVRLFDEWIDSEYFISMSLPFGWEENIEGDLPISKVDFIRYGSGSVLEYLSENIPSYQNNKSKVDSFFEKELEYISQDRFTKNDL